MRRLRLQINFHRVGDTALQSLHLPIIHFTMPCHANATATTMKLTPTPKKKIPILRVWVKLYAYNRRR